MPMLIIGALTGGVFGQFIIKFWHFDPSFANNFVVFAMAAYFTAIVKAPITGSILITEMTGSFEHLPALITVSMTAYIVADLLKSKPVYDTLLNRVLAKGKHESLDVNPSASTVMEAVVCMGSQLEGKVIRDITWPRNCLLINIKRGEEQVIPRGDTKIMAGDYLNILTNEKQANRYKPALVNMAGHDQSSQRD